MTALDHSRKRAAPPNPPRIRGDACEKHGDRKRIASIHHEPGPSTVISDP